MGLNYFQDELVADLDLISAHTCKMEFIPTHKSVSTISDDFSKTVKYFSVIGTGKFMQIH